MNTEPVNIRTLLCIRVHLFHKVEDMSPCLMVLAPVGLTVTAFSYFEAPSVVDSNGVGQTQCSKEHSLSCYTEEL